VHELQEGVLSRLKNAKKNSGNPHVHELQEGVLSRLEALEKSGLDAHAKEIPQVKFLSHQLCMLLGDIQNSWREGDLL
jgi:hypothetical protein